jgi:murein L,D-transpeptidase YafK
MGTARHLIDLEGSVRLGFHVCAVAGAALLLAACAPAEIPPHLRPLSRETVMLLGKKSMRTDQPIFIRIFKEESELEVWKQRDDGRFYHVKTYPICNWSGELGPKIREGDRQAPEGFYKVARQQMNPNSRYHLAFNLGYPNVYDKTQGRTGEFVMVHGKCKSAGCYAMTDELMEEIYALSREAFIGGQDIIEVHAYPFRMTDENLARYQQSEHYAFWSTLKQAYDYFELTRRPPAVAVCEKRYIVNVKWRGSPPSRIDPDQVCPAYDQPNPDPFKPAGHMKVAEERVTAPGAKKRALAVSTQGGMLSGLTNGGLGKSSGFNTGSTFGVGLASAIR